MTNEEHMKAMIQGMDNIIDNDLKNRGIDTSLLYDAEIEAIHTFYYGMVCEYLIHEHLVD